MKEKKNPDTSFKGKLSEAYKSQDKAPRKGVKAQDQDEYDAKGFGPYKKSVQAYKAYSAQEKAPQGRGSRGPSQSDGMAIKGWDVPVKANSAYANQHYAKSESSETKSLGFKLQSETSAYLGHFAEEKWLRKGHNDVGDAENIPSISQWNDTVSAALTKKPDGSKSKNSSPSSKPKSQLADYSGKSQDYSPADENSSSDNSGGATSPSPDEEIA